MRELGLEARPKLIKEWNLFKSLGASAKVERECRKRLCEPGVAASFEPRQGAKEFLKAVRAKAKVYAVTAPLEDSPTWIQERNIWLQEKLGFSLDRIIQIYDKWLVHGNVLVDDKLENVELWQAEHPTGKAILWHESHNAAVPWSGARVRGYKQLLVMLEKM